jgi:hypothetical protein
MSEAISEGICPVSCEKERELTASEARGLWVQIFFQLSRKVRVGPEAQKIDLWEKE